MNNLFTLALSSKRPAISVFSGSFSRSGSPVFLFCFLFLCFLSVRALAQPKLSLSVDTVLFEPGEVACLDFIVEDFDKLQEMNFTVQWNPEVLTNIEVGQDILPVDAVIEVDEAAGTLSFSWKVEDIPNCPPVDSFLTLPDGSLLFSLCFEGVAGYTEIAMEDTYATRVYACPLNIGLFADTAFVDTGTFFVGSSSPELEGIHIYPNPTQDALFFDVPQDGRTYSLRLFNATGKLLQTTPSAGTNRVALPAKGIYFLAFYVEGQAVRVERVIRF